MRVWEGRWEARRQRAQVGGRGGIASTEVVVSGADEGGLGDRLTCGGGAVINDVEF